MSKTGEIREKVRKLPVGKEFRVADLNLADKVERNLASILLAILCKKSELVRRVEEGLYERIDKKSSDLGPKIPKKKKSEEKKDEGSKLPDPGGDLVLGKRNERECLIKLTKSSLLNLFVNNEISFRVNLRCSRIEKNFQGEIVSFSLDAISICIDEPENKSSSLSRRNGDRIGDSESTEMAEED